MAKKKKNRNRGPRRKRMKQPARLASAKAKSWAMTCDEKNPIKRYAKWFGVDLLCAMHELRLLGSEISPEREKQVRQSLKGRKRKKPKANSAPAIEDLFNEEAEFGFAYIAGYTPGGMPYGLTLDEMEDIKEDDFARTEAAWQEINEIERLERLASLDNEYEASPGANADNLEDIPF